MSAEETPAVPARVRTAAYYVLLVVAALTLLASLSAPIWFAETTATKIVAQAGALSSVAGLVAGGLGVAYRPTRGG